MKNIQKERIRNLKLMHKADSIYQSPMFSFIAVIAFVAIDLTCLYTVWNTVATENPLMIIMIAVGCAICLDVPLAIAAQALKAYHKGAMSLKATLLIFIPSVIAFLVTFAFSVAFRIVTKDISFDVSAGSMLVDTSADAANSINASEDSPIVWWAALFTAIIPFATSLSSFVISYYSFDPILIRIMNKTKAQIANQHEIAERKRMLEEAETEEEFCRLRAAYEKDRYFAHLGMIDSYESYLNHLAAAAVRNRLGTPEAVTEATEYGYNLNGNNSFNEAFDMEIMQMFESITSATEDKNTENSDG